MTRLALALALAACTPHVAPQHHGRALMSTVPAQYGACGAVAVIPGERVAPQHCDPPGVLRCDEWRDLCWIADEPRVRLAAVRLPVAGESVTVTLPTGDDGRATVLATSIQWRAAWLDWPCLRGDSGGVAWGEDGAAVCMLTGCEPGRGRTYCVELTHW